MASTQRNGIQAWGWAVGINLVVFILLWIAMINIPAPVHSEDKPPSDTQPTVAENGSQPLETEPVDAIEPSVSGSGEVLAHIDQSVSTPSEVEIPEVWINEFYLGSGPPISFSPRLNDDGTPRSHPSPPDQLKAPTYEDEDRNYDPDDLNPPKMTPSIFSKLDLPEVYRDKNFHVTVRVHLDARGRVLGTPEIIESSGYPEVDEITIEKIMNDVSIEPATYKDTGQPVPLHNTFWILWED